MAMVGGKLNSYFATMNGAMALGEAVKKIAWATVVTYLAIGVIKAGGVAEWLTGLVMMSF